MEIWLVNWWNSLTSKTSLPGWVKAWLEDLDDLAQGSPGGGHPWVAPWGVVAGGEGPVVIPSALVVMVTGGYWWVLVVTDDIWWVQSWTQATQVSIVTMNHHSPSSAIDEAWMNHLLMIHHECDSSS